MYYNSHMSHLSLKVISDPSQAKTLWELFSPHQALDDEWDFRYVFIKDFNFPLHFIVGYDGEKPIGLLALQRNTLKGLGPALLGMNEPFLEFFGGVDTDNNKVLVLPGYEEVISQFLEHVKEKAVLSDLRDPYERGDQKAINHNNRYELDLVKIKSFEEYLQANFDGKNRQRLINRLNKIQKNYQLEVKDGKGEDLELLFKLSIERFGEKSSFNRQDRQILYKDIFTSLEHDFFVVSVNGVPKAASLALLHKKTYTSLNIGYDYDTRDLGKFVIATQMKRAWSKGYELYDAGKGDNGWKEQFRLTKIPLYQLRLNI